MRIAPAIALSPEQRTLLVSQAGSRSLPVRVAERARIVLFAAFGQQDLEIAARMAITPKKVSRWRKRFLALGVVGLQKDAPRPGRKPTISTRLTKRVVTMTTRQQPTNATHWSTPTMTHDYKRNGTATLFAALNAANGEVFGLCQERHRHQEWLRFLRLIDQTIPADRQLHLICDNYATHKHPKVQRWLQRHPRFHLHFTPTSASWLNMVERFFRDLTQNRLRRGVFRDLEELIMAIGTYIDRHNENPKPFIWTARAADLPEKVNRVRRPLNNRQSA